MAEETTKKSTGDLEHQLGELRSALRQFRFDMTGSKARNTKAGKNIRKEIAVILTELNVRLKAGVTK